MAPRPLCLTFSLLSIASTKPPGSPRLPAPLTSTQTIGCRSISAQWLRRPPWESGESPPSVRSAGARKGCVAGGSTCSAQEVICLHSHWHYIYTLLLGEGNIMETVQSPVPACHPRPINSHGRVAQRTHSCDSLHQSPRLPMPHHVLRVSACSV